MPGVREGGEEVKSERYFDLPPGYRLDEADPDAHTRRLHAELFLLPAEKLEEALHAFVEETSFDRENMP